MAKKNEKLRRKLNKKGFNIPIGAVITKLVNMPKQDILKKCSSEYKKYWKKKEKETKELFMPKQQEWEKEFDKEFIPMTVNYDEALDGYRYPETKLKQFIQTQIDKAKIEIPMGVSQWVSHGKKYGYWEYFKRETIESVEKGVDSWVYNYTNYMTQMATKKTYDKGNLAKELSEELKSYLKQFK